VQIAPVNATKIETFSISTFIFEGFLPKKQSERNKILFDISKNTKTTIVYESPHRINKLLVELKNFCGGDREVQLYRELTKKFEEHIGNNINEVIDYLKDKEIMGEITILIKGLNLSKNQDINLVVLKNELNELIKAGLSLSAASKFLAKKYGIKKSIIYNLN